MKSRLTSLLLTAALLGSVGGVATVSTADAAAKPAWTKNCTALNKKHSHGVGKAKAVDKVKGKTKKVTNFTKSDKLYAEAMKYNKGLDGDKDGIACEKR